MVADEGAPEPGGYSIRVVSRLTGIAADTLRMWERRYGFPAPERGDTGIRAYSEADLERLHLVVRALEAGHRPGRVVPLGRDALEELLRRTEGPRPDPAPAEVGTGSIEPVLDALLGSEPQRAEQLVRAAAPTLGARAFLLDFAAPLAREVGDRWHRGEIGIRHEHLVTEALMTQLDVLCSTYSDPRGRPTLLLSCLPGEHHTLGLAMTRLYATLAGARVHSLGGNTPPDEIAAAARELGAEAVGLSLVDDADAAERRRHVEAVRAGLPKGAEIWLGGRAAAALAPVRPPIVLFSTWAELDAHLARLHGAPGRKLGPAST